MPSNKVRLRENPIFICGHPKSGTSLIRSLMDGHPQLIVYPEETVFFRKFIPSIQGADKQTQIDIANKKIIHIFDWDSTNPPANQAGYLDRDYSAISKQQVQNEMQKLLQDQFNHTGDILSAAILAYGYATSKINTTTVYWVEKSPYNEYYVSQILEWWPKARFIHIVRDPRDNYASYRRKHPDWTPEFFSQNWIRSTNTGIENQKLLGEERYWILQYEELVRSPQKTLTELIDFLKITWNPILAQPTRAGQSWSGNSMFENSFDAISDAPIGRWSRELSPEDVLIIEIMTRELMNHFHYESAFNENGALHNKKKSSLLLQTLWRVNTWKFRRKLSGFKHL